MGYQLFFQFNVLMENLLQIILILKIKKKEIILMPNSYFEVIGQLNPASQLDIIQLKEITPSVTSVKEPFNQPANINPPYTKKQVF
jgi:hypothetical protein